MKLFEEYFKSGTERTVSGASIGMEIETDFTSNGVPISEEVSRKILAITKGRPKICEQKLELGRQKIELSIQPQPTISLLLESAHESLAWLYKQASIFDAKPYFAPELQWPDPLLFVQEERDEIWVEVDGRTALEHLCRCSSVQYTVSINPFDAIQTINKLWRSQLHILDYASNEWKWQNYIADSKTLYRPDRFGGPYWFDSIHDYANELANHYVVMHQGKPVWAHAKQFSNLNVDLFLRSVWWNYRLRRYGNTLAVEMRPFARREDTAFLPLWQKIAEVIGM
jgi:hypothetical protein